MERFVKIDLLKRFHIGDHGTIKTDEGLVIKPSLNDKGYLKAYLCVSITPGERKKKNFYIHQLVGLAFIPNTENKPCINHIDGNKLNNHYANLEWCTIAENLAHASANGLLKNKIAHNRNRSKVYGIELVRKIKANGKYASYRQMSEDYNMNPSTIFSILSNKIWKYIDE
jgi:hypothetical protein